MRAAVACALALAIAACAGSKENEAGSQQRAELQREIAFVRSEGAPGVVAAIRSRAFTANAAVGLAQLRPRRAMRPDDRFRIASVTKTFVATVVLQLVGEGRLRLADTVERWLPGVLPQGRRITLRQLLSHTSGLFNYTEALSYLEGLERNLRTVVTPRAQIALAASKPLGFRPGSDWHYSNTGYQILGLVIERVEAKPLGAVLSDRIFQPLELQHTSLEDRPHLAEPVAHGYTLPGGFFPVGAKPLDVTQSVGGGAWADGAIVSTADDVARFFQALLGGKVLRPALLRQMLRTVPAEGPVRYGLGIALRRVSCGYAWGHDGGFLGYVTRVRATRDGRKVVVLGANGDSYAVDGALSATADLAYCGA